MDDYVSRNAIIQMFNTADRYVADSLRLCDTDKQFPQNEVFIVDDMYEGLEQLPSAQPEKRTNKRTETHECDYISRQQAIGIVNGYEDRMMRYIGTSDDSEKYAYARGLLLSIDRNIKALSSAQPEDCDTCKHGYFGNKQCDNCSVRFPSHYERRTDERSD